MDIDNHGIEDDLKALEHRLIAWRPAAGALDRDRMLYDAGRAVAVEGRVRSWRLATAALLLVSIGLGGSLVHQRSLLARERSRTSALSTALAAGAVKSQPSPPPIAVEIPPIEPPAPNSYFALTTRLAQGVTEGSWPDVQSEPEPHRPGLAPKDEPPGPAPLRPRDVQRVLDL
jgi:hypothetical protein